MNPPSSSKAGSTTGNVDEPALTESFPHKSNQRIGLARLESALHSRTSHLSPSFRGLMWAIGAGVCFAFLNSLMRLLTQEVPPFQSQFLRYSLALLLLIPWVLWSGPKRFMAKDIKGQFTRGALHTVGLGLWFVALPKIPLADTTALGFMTPIFVMMGAYFFFKEPMRWERWLATAFGFIGVLVVVGPKLSFTNGNWYHLVMFSCAPVFAASFLLTKALTRHETAGTILVWQALVVSIFSLPLAVVQWQSLQPIHWLGFFIGAVLGSVGHYCLTRSFAAAEISATQGAKFLDLAWSVLLGWLIFSEVPTSSTLAGGLLICGATLWLARREAKRRVV